MIRYLAWVALAALALQVSPVLSSPVNGHRREGEIINSQRRVPLDPGITYKFSETFRVNQRACVMVEGDHKPVMNLTLRVIDGSGAVVAEDKGGGDFVFATWYPPKTQAYQIQISADGTIVNLLEVIVK
jgi:hypothetical protein